MSDMTHDDKGRDLPALPDENDCIVHAYPSDLKRMEKTECAVSVYSVAVGCPGERSVPLYTADQMREYALAALATVSTAQPVAWGVPNSRPTERQPFMQILMDKTGVQYPELLVPLYAGPVSTAPSKESRAGLREIIRDVCFDSPTRDASGNYILSINEIEQIVAQTAPSEAEIPAILFDGYAVLQALSDKAKARTSPENVADVLDAVVKAMKAGQTAAPQDKESGK